MPELPEVETIAKRLKTVVCGKTISEVSVFKQKSFYGDSQSLLGVPILDVSRKAKLIRFHLPNAQNLLIHLKMTGQLIYIDATGSRLGGGHPTADWVSQLPSNHTRVSFKLLSLDKTQHSLYFNDMRIFGWIRLLSDSQILAEYRKYAPDINTDTITLEYFAQKLQKTTRPIKQVIMDNAVISGVGNIYACDGLNLAFIHPQRPANSLSDAETSKLLQALKEVIDLGIELGGATIDNYRTVDGFAGKYQEKVRVYSREGENCCNCGGIIQKIKLGGRGTYFCQNCQI